jgi:hypothetical protein
MNQFGQALIADAPIRFQYLNDLLIDPIEREMGSCHALPTLFLAR